MLLALLTFFLWTFQYFPNVFLMTHLPGPRTLLIGRILSFTQTHRYAKRNRFFTTDNSYLALTKYTLPSSSSSSPLGVNTFPYLPALYKHFPFFLLLPPGSASKEQFVGWRRAISLSHHSPPTYGSTDEGRPITGRNKQQTGFNFKARSPILGLNIFSKILILHQK